ncbi:UNVERIFIED_CONTAM: hypothetical protein NCL1_12341 [Trichonephila clavipes]
MTIVRKLSVVQLHIKEDGRFLPVYQLLQRQQHITNTPNATMTLFLFEMEKSLFTRKMHH